MPATRIDTDKDVPIPDMFDTIILENVSLPTQDGNHEIRTHTRNRKDLL